MASYCKECDIDKNWNRTTFTNNHDKNCSQYSDYEEKAEAQRKYALTLNQFDQCLKIHSSPRPIDAKCALCYSEYWLSQGHQCDNLIGFPLEMC